MATRRCLSNCAARGVGMVLMRDLHHSTVTQWEIKLRACMIAASKEYFRSASADVAQHALDQAPGWKYMINAYRSDATNANV